MTKSDRLSPPISMIHSLRTGALLGVSLGGMTGLCIAVFAISLAGWQSLWDASILSIYITAGYAVPGGLLGLFSAAIARFLPLNFLFKKNVPESIKVAVFWLFGASMVYLHLFSPLRFISLPFADRAMSFGGMLAWTTGGALIMTGILGFILHKIPRILIPLHHWMVRNKNRLLKFGLPSFILCWFLVLLIVTSTRLENNRSNTGTPAPQIDNPTHQVLMIAWDGATWDVIDPLLAEGRMPHLARLIQQGSRHNLQTLEIGLSALIWPEILTGEPPERHGILGFTAYRLPLIGREFVPPPHRTGLGKMIQMMTKMGLASTRPTNASDRKVSAIWELASLAGLKVGVMDGYTTYPAIPVQGYLVSSHAYPHLHSTAYPSSATETDSPYAFPANLLSGLKKDFDTTNHIPENQLARFVNLPSNQLSTLAQVERLDRSQPASYLKVHLVHDQFRLTAGRRLWKEYNPDFSFLFLNGIDGIQHYLWKFHEPDKFSGVDPNQATALKDTINEYYCWLDETLGEIVADATDQTNIILLSDHGHDPVFFGSKGKSGDHQWGPDGILVMAGPAFQKLTASNTTPKPYIADIAPTILYLLGLPISEELQGRILTETIQPELLKQNPPQTIPRYPRPGQIDIQDEDSAVDQGILDRLKGLGYL